MNCFDPDLHPHNWAIVIVKEKEYKDYMIEKINTKTENKALKTAQDAESDAAAKAAITKETIAGTWAKVDKTSPKVQLPEFNNPGRFQVDDSWTGTQLTKKQQQYYLDKDRYCYFSNINKALIKLLGEIFGQERWSDLDTGNKFVDIHTARKILEHLEKKFNKEQPIDIKDKLKRLNKPPDLSKHSKTTSSG